MQPSASQGCPLCARFMACHQSFKLLDKTSSTDTPLNDLLLLHHDNITDAYHLSAHMNGYGWLRNVRITDLKQYDKTTLHQKSVARPDQIQLGALEHSTAQVQKWLEECTSRHVRCRTKNATILPTRLISIASSLVHLHITHADDSIRYATLSHCWGRNGPLKLLLKLLKSTIADYQTQIPLHTLSKTFKDTIQIAKVLGFSYLWIDSLCIIHVDDDDLRYEAGRMADVYGHSSLNIAATSAVDGSIGCLFPRDPIIPTALHVQIQGSNSESTVLEIKADTTGTLQYEGPLYKRAWVLQELILAPRNLHFLADQLAWDCNEANACEAFPTGLMNDQPGGMAALRRDFRKNWPFIVRAYTEAKLSFYSDKALAIAGIARAMAMESNDAYCLGLWKSTFIRDLCWVSEQAKSWRGTSSKDVLFPTWSWLSLPDAIVAIGYHCNITAKYINLVSTEIFQHNEFGDIRYGILVLEASYLLAVTCFHDPKTKLELVKFTFGRYKYCREARFHIPLGSNDHYLHFLPIYSYTRKHQRIGIIGLLLERISSSRRGTFRRVGSVDVNIGYDWQTPADSLKEIITKHLSDHSASCCVPGDTECVSERVDEEGRKWYQIELE